MLGVQVIEGAVAKLVDCLVEKNNTATGSSKANTTLGHSKEGIDVDVQGLSDLAKAAGSVEAFHVKRLPPAAVEGASADLELVPEHSLLSVTAGIQPAFGAQASP